MINAVNDVRQILNGIDKQETEDRSGWWDTSVGCAFGAAKLAEICAYVDEREIEWFKRASQIEAFKADVAYQKCVTAKAHNMVSELHLKLFETKQQMEKDMALGKETDKFPSREEFLASG